MKKFKRIRLKDGSKKVTYYARDEHDSGFDEETRKILMDKSVNASTNKKIAALALRQQTILTELRLISDKLDKLEK